MLQNTAVLCIDNIAVSCINCNMIDRTIATVVKIQQVSYLHILYHSIN